ncbi:MAG: hypothetical protein AAGA48_24810 [Myxococcota bacterium]
MAADDEDVTDNMPVPDLKASTASVPVKLEADGTTHDAKLQSAAGDQITVVASQSLPMDAQVQVNTTDGALTGMGVVISTREAGDAGVAIGIEILGGAADWAKLLA